MDLINKYQLAELVLRLFCGVIFLFQGYDKLFKVKISGVTDTFMINAQKRNIPTFLVTFAAAYTSIVEFFGGFLLIIGLFKNFTLLFLGLDIVLVTVAFSMFEPIWDMRHVFPRLVSIFVLMILPEEWEYFSLDTIIKHL